MLLGELRRWGARPATTVDELLPHADRALDWIADYGDRDGDGFVEYRRDTDRGPGQPGLEGLLRRRQRSPTARWPSPPIALAEVQGYVYAAYLARAALRRRSAATPAWRAALAGDRRGSSRHAFNETFWLPDQGYYALGLDGDKRPIDALASNMGHCLWTGIVDEDKAAAVAEHLISPDDVHRLRGADAGHHHGRLQPDELPQRLGLAARQRDLSRPG